jgi:hypothetical protein
MTAEMWIIAAVRIAGSLPVLRWPFYGAVLAILVDLSDLFMMNLLHLGGVRDYQSFDKYLDQVYMLCFLAVALRWSGPARDIAVGLYIYRLAGFVAFELTGERDVLLLFPNFFEVWFLLVAGLYHFRYEPFSSKGTAANPGGIAASTPARAGRVAVLATHNASVASPHPRRASTTAFAALAGALAGLKLFQEYALHNARWLDGFTAVEAVEAAWRFATPPY